MNVAGKIALSITCTSFCKSFCIQATSDPKVYKCPERIVELMQEAVRSEFKKHNITLEKYYELYNTKETPQR